MNSKILAVLAGAAVLWAVYPCGAQMFAPPGAAGAASTPDSPLLPPTSFTVVAVPAASSSPAAASGPAPRLDALGDPLPPGAVACLGTTRLRQTSEALVVAFNPDGNSFATGHADGSICLWERSTGRLLHRLTGHTQPVSGLDYAGPRMVVSGAGDKSLRWWDVVSGAALGKVDEPAGVSAMASGNGGRSIVVAAGRTLQIFEAATANRVDELRLGGPVGDSIATIPGDDRVIVASPDGNIHLIHLNFRKEVGLIPLEAKGQTVMAASPDGRTLAWGEPGGRIRLADIATGALFHPMVGHLDTVRCMVFSPDSHQIASRGGDGKVRLWNAQSGRQLWEADCCGNTRSSLAFSPDGKVLAVARADHSVGLLSTATGKSAIDTPGHTEPVFALAISPDGHTLVSGASGAGSGTHDTLRAWDLGTMQPLWRTPERYGAGALHIAWRADGKVLATSGGDRRVRLWDAADGREAGTLPRGGEAATSCRPQFAPDGNFVVFAQVNGSVGIWQPATQKVADFARSGGGPEIASLACAPDGRCLAVARGGRIELLDANGAPMATVGEAGQPWFDLRFTADSSRLMGAGPGGLGVWEVPGGRQVFAAPAAPHKAMLSVDLSPDGKLIAAVGSDGNLSLWTAATGEQIACWPAHGGHPSAVVFLPDGKRICSAGLDTQILVWPVEELVELQRRAAMRP